VRGLSDVSLNSYKKVRAFGAAMSGLAGEVILS
jgi:hypothetical protein